ncbi:hypothetical protein GCM10011579_087590 [Streptomyces albiflavescens]|uniref:Tyr recombinase domain-containing protein n=2 Tax=Streptomyces albiflavescens TaxID=1623582 RepID=A0A918DAN7_9ACTN|nr:hypothetical protein GCM10011579_087590 [Streptomyces albiflavescens]
MATRTRPHTASADTRHTLGTQLAEKGARVQTIMKVLGHKSPGMSMTYTHISGPTVLADYQAVLQPGATIAGPLADTLRSGQLDQDALDWLKTNFYKTELELGRCLRLPQEGPCECDLYLSCAKFVTTPQYATRLRERLCVERQLITDATDRGWEREIDRHQRVADLITSRVPDHRLEEVDLGVEDGRLRPDAARRVGGAGRHRVRPRSRRTPVAGPADPARPTRGRRAAGPARCQRSPGAPRPVSAPTGSRSGVPRGHQSSWPGSDS